MNPLIEKLMKQKIIDMINERKAEAMENHKESSRLGINSYGAGADQGEIDMCNILLQDLADLE